jgi:hypothetical protein
MTTISKRTLHWRPQSARAVAGRSRSLEQFGMNLRDWIHALRAITTTDSFLVAVSHRPPRLRGKFIGGEIADAFLAAQVEFLCNRAGLRPPKWVFDSEYTLEEPWYGMAAAVGSAKLRDVLRRDADPEFSRRNLFTNSEIEWHPDGARPIKLPYR